MSLSLGFRDKTTVITVDEPAVTETDKVVVRTATKCMHINIKSTIHWEFVPDGVIVNLDFYCYLLRWFQRSCVVKKIRIVGKTKFGYTQCACIQLPQNNKVFDREQYDSYPTPFILSGSSLLWLYFVSQTKIEAERLSLCTMEDTLNKNCRQCCTDARKGTLPVLLRGWRGLETMYIIPRRLFRRRWWPFVNKVTKFIFLGLVWVLSNITLYIVDSMYNHSFGNFLRKIV